MNGVGGRVKLFISVNFYIEGQHLIKYLTDSVKFIELYLQIRSFELLYLKVTIAIVLAEWWEGMEPIEWSKSVAIGLILLLLNIADKIFLVVLNFLYFNYENSL